MLSGQGGFLQAFPVLKIVAVVPLKMVTTYKRLFKKVSNFISASNIVCTLLLHGMAAKHLVNYEFQRTTAKIYILIIKIIVKCLVHKNTKTIHRISQWRIKIVLEHTDNKENQIFLIYKENESGAVAKSYMRKGFL